MLWVGGCRVRKARGCRSRRKISGDAVGWPRAKKARRGYRERWRWRVRARHPSAGARPLDRRGVHEASRSRSENGGVEATRGLCSRAPVQSSAKGAAPEGVELAHARTRSRGRERGEPRPRPRTRSRGRPRGTYVPLQTRPRNRRAGRSCARVRGGGGREREMGGRGARHRARGHVTFAGWDVALRGRRPRRWSRDTSPVRRSRGAMG